MAQWKVKEVSNLEHPDITKTLKKGYPAQPEHAGSDYFGDEILVGDEIVTDPNTREVVLKENIVQYLKVVYAFQFITAE